MNVCCNKSRCSVRQCKYHPVNNTGIKNREDMSHSILCTKPGKDIPVPSESEEQQALFKWADALCFRYPELSLLHHIPNEGKRSKSTGVKMKREGMKSGIPDIHLPVASGEYHSLYIELKRRKGSTITQSQSTWIQLLGKYGNAAYICYGWEEAAKVIEEYLELK